MTRAVIVAIVGLAIAGWPGKSWATVPHVFLDERTGPHLEKVIGVANVEFEQSRLHELALAFADEVDKRHVTGTLWIVTSAEDSERVQGVRITGLLYVGWRHDWMREYRAKYPVARVSVIDEIGRASCRERV